MEITDYDKWKFRRCLETMNRYGCIDTDNGSESDRCKQCGFDIDNNKWGYLHIRLTCDGNPDRIVINNVLE